MPRGRVSKASIELKLDHFKVYKQYNYEDQQPRKLRLQGQFDKQAMPAEIDHMLYFANPVRKNAEDRILNKNAHLAFYALQGPVEPRRVVVAKNQFGLQKLLIDHPVYLLVPSQKVEPGSAFPRGLDHYKAYNILEGKLIDAPALLADQVDPQNKVMVARPALFCVPVKKSYGNQSSPISNPAAHLTFYTITPRVYRVSKVSRDQFGEHKLLLATSVYLGVPTAKLDYDVLG